MTVGGERLKHAGSEREVRNNPGFAAFCEQATKHTKGASLHTIPRCSAVIFSSSGLSSRVSSLRPPAVSPPQLIRTGCPQDPRQAVEQQLHRGTKMTWSWHHSISSTLLHITVTTSV